MWLGQLSEGNGRCPRRDSQSVSCLGGMKPMVEVLFGREAYELIWKRGCVIGRLNLEWLGECSLNGPAQFINMSKPHGPCVYCPCRWNTW